MEPLPLSIRSTAEHRLRTRGIHGVALGAFDGDRMLFAGGVGYSDVATARPADTETVFRVASISKLLTATLVLRLADDGVLDIDAPVNSHLPADLQILDQSGRPATSTLATLLSHSSGLPVGVRGIEVGNRALSLLTNQGTITDLASSITDLRLTHGPDEQVVYSNPAFNVLGHVAARAVGQRFEDAARSMVLEPMGMMGSAFATERSGPQVATQYGTVIPPKVSHDPAEGFALVATPMGGLTSTVADLARFGQMVLRRGEVDGNPFLSSELVTRATTVRATNHPDLEHGYGLGFKSQPWRGRTMVGHDGNMPGVATQLALSPDDGVGVVVLTNGYALSVPHELAALTLEHVLGLEPRSTSPAASPGDDETRRPAEALGRRAQGTYRMVDGSPPGLVGRLGDLTTRVQVTHEAHGRLRVEGNPGSDGPAWLVPTATVGRYQVAAGVDDGTTAIIEERPDGPHLWMGYSVHLRRR